MAIKVVSYNTMQERDQGDDNYKPVGEANGPKELVQLADKTIDDNRKWLGYIDTDTGEHLNMDTAMIKLGVDPDHLLDAYDQAYES